MENKTDAELQILGEIAESTEEMSEDLKQLLGFDSENVWQVLVKYNGDIEAVARQEGGIAQIINNQFAILTIEPGSIDHLLDYTEVEYMETPKRLIYTATQNMTASCIPEVQNNAPYQLKGSGVLLGIIDSGINYAHPDFRNEDGTTRITSIWDQTITGNPPEGFLQGSEYTRAQIDEALQQPTKAERLAVVPSEDLVGHGTHVAGIAGGNGRASNGQIVGVAPEAEFIIVKLGRPDAEGFVRNIEIMLAVKYVLERATALGKPVAINLSLGMNTGPHDGNALLEQYLGDAATVWKNNIVVGSGNEGDARNHTAGTVAQDSVSRFQFQIGPNTVSYNLSVWYNPIDSIAFRIINPSGRSTPMITYAGGPKVYNLLGTRVYTAFGGPSPLSSNLEFSIYMTGTGEVPITSGPWTVELYGRTIVDGRFDVWGPTVEAAGESNYILESIVTTTLTTPSTSPLVISVGAYNSTTGQIAPFSGRGYGRNESVIKPDLVAPGVEIQGPSHTTFGYRTLSGTSMAAPHVTGGVALLMEWGIVEGNNPFLYGENLKVYLLKGALRTTEGVSYPSPVWGYGRLCVRNSLDVLRQQLVL